MPATQDEARAALERIVALTERETELLETLDVDGLDLLHAERAGLLDVIGGAYAGDDAEPLVMRLRDLSRANEAIASAQSAALRQRLAHLGSGRRAINAYAPGGGTDIRRSAWLDRAG